MKISTRYVCFVIATLALTACAAAPSITPNYYFQDRVDSGNDGRVAGCHFEYLTNACADNQVLGVVGDSCDGDVAVNEWTNDDQCHQHVPAAHQDDQAHHNCDTLCGTPAGVSSCEVVFDACTYRALTVNSAKCVCPEKSKSDERQPTVE